MGWTILWSAALTLTIGSAVATKRITTRPVPLASVVAPAAPTPPAPTASSTPIARSSATDPGAGAIVDPLLFQTDHTAPAPEPAPIAQQPDPAPSARIITAPAGYERYYDGRPLRRARTLWMTVTAYSPDHRSCGKFADGITASGMSVWTNGMQLVAADPRVLPRNTLITVPGYAEGAVVPVLDVGGAIKGSRLDVLYPSHAVARRWGVQTLKVTVWEYADE
ncbi:MAG: 3D domain-containing protein [Phycisphaerales bacterium]